MAWFSGIFFHFNAFSLVFIHLAGRRTSRGPLMRPCPGGGWAAQGGRGRWPRTSRSTAPCWQARRPRGRMVGWGRGWIFKPVLHWWDWRLLIHAKKDKHCSLFSGCCLHFSMVIWNFLIHFLIPLHIDAFHMISLRAWIDTKADLIFEKFNCF